MHIRLAASKLLAIGLPLATLIPAASAAEGPADIAALRQEIDSIRSAYEARLLALEQRLKAAERGIATAAAGFAPAVVATTPPTPAAVAPVAQPVKAIGDASNAFNPALSLILSGLYARTSSNPASVGIAGFHVKDGAEVGWASRGFSLTESELGLSAHIDSWLRGVASVALHPDDAVSVEEAYVQTTSLGHGLSFKAGRFLSNVGYLNAQHAHSWDFADNPLAYQTLLGTQLADDGLQLRWLAPTDRFIELGIELGRGRSFPGGDNNRNGPGLVTLAAHAGGDIGDSHSWRAGVSVLGAKAEDQALAGLDGAGRAVSSRFSGRTRVWVADAVWKWAPDGNATRTSFKLQGEYLRSTREGNLLYDTDNANASGAYRAVQSGWYLQGVWQFMPAWRLGLRTERLHAGTPRFEPGAQLLGSTGFAPGKNTWMLDFSPSEFSRVRLQWADDRSRPGSADRQLVLQYQTSLGAHGAHGY